VLVSTPYMDEADRCHQVGILYQGRLLTSGAPTQLQNALPFEILEVKAMPRKAIRALINGGQDGVLRWRPVGDRLRLSVTDLRKTEGYLRKGLRRARAEVSICRPAKATMEDVFIHLVETQREAQ
ncbi:MAG: hypothetical protein JW862_08890, partial [Anaerolineales bacterium]|nr:hypothetical protein [Anaerolineales bacterium]